MSEFTPTTERMRNVYASVHALGIRSGPPGGIEYNHGKAKFDRWLAEMERAAAARALEDAAGYLAAESHQMDRAQRDANKGYVPIVPGAIASGIMQASHAVPARAAEIREEK